MTSIHPTRRLLRHQAGSMLLESLVAIVIVAIGAVGLVEMQSALINQAALAKVRSEATTLAEAKIDDLRDTMLSSEHFGASCTVGSRMASGSDTASGSANATYTRSWVVTPYCNPTRHQVRVTVAWGPAAGDSVVLNSLIAWNNPASQVTSAGSGGTGSPGFGDPSTARLINEAPVSSLPTGSDALRNDGTSTYYDATSDEFWLYVKDGAEFRRVLASTVPLVPLSGLIAVENVSGFSVDMTTVRVVASEAVYCTLPLRFSEQNNPSSYGVNGGTLSAANDKAAAYVCYVPTGWTGTIGLFERNSNASCGSQLFKNNKGGSCNFTEALACPEFSDGAATLTGERTVKALVLDGSNAIIGQSGVLPGHSTMKMPDNSGLHRTERLDFAIYKPANGNPPQRCASIFANLNSGLSGTVNSVNYSVIQRPGAGFNESVKYGVPSMRYPFYVIESYSGNGGFATVSGSVGACSAPLVATGSGSFLNKDYDCNVSGASYSCQVSIGWTGTIGTTTIASAVPVDGLSVDVCP